MKQRHAQPVAIGKADYSVCFDVIN